MRSLDLCSMFSNRIASYFNRTSEVEMTVQLGGNNTNKNIVNHGLPNQVVHTNIYSWRHLWGS